MNITPDPEDIVQAEEDDYTRTPEPVVVCGPVETRELPAQRAGYKTDQGVTATVAVKLLPFEPRRKEAMILPVDQDIWLSGSQAGAQAGAAGAILVPVGTLWPVRHLAEVWACAATGTTDISVASDYWSQ